MADWRSYIFERLGVGLRQLIIAEDPDELLLDEGIQIALKERGYGFTIYDDPVAFRYTYESEYRPSISGEEGKPLLVRAPQAGFRGLPYDVLRRGRRVQCALDELFPSLHYATVAELDSQWYDALWKVRPDDKTPRMGEQETKLFVLRHVFEVDPAAIHTAEDLLRVLLRRHYRGQQVSPSVDDYLIGILGERQSFRKWPLRQIIPDRENFLRFLQERWPLFVKTSLSLAHSDENGRIVPEPQGGDFAIPGPAKIPFGHEDIRVYIDNFFLEGLLHPIEPPGSVSKNSWVTVGLDIDPEKDRARRAEHLLRVLDEDLPAVDAHHKAWFAYAPRWAELVALVAHGELPASLVERHRIVQQRLDHVFVEWVLARYDSLRTQPVLPPVMLHHVPRFLMHERQHDQKVALLLVDGLSLDQWITLGSVLGESVSGVRFREEAVFAWLPTLTSVSRQAAFAAQAPHYFKQSINRTDRDGAGWQRFWQDQGLSSSQAPYLNVSGTWEDFGRAQELLDDARTQTAGIVVRKVDEVVHGMELASAGMHSQIRLWAQEPFMPQLIQLLLDRNFRIFLTADHGNVESVGCGRPEGGLTAVERGERVRVYETDLARTTAADTVPGAVSWTPSGLPEGYETLFAPPRKAFTHEGKRVMTHGGISVEEVIVPFIHIHC